MPDFIITVRDALALLFRYRKVLWATTKVEFAKRYAGSLFGKLWIILNPALLLSIYLFVYLVIFKMKFPGYSQLDYVAFVFCGLVPYIGFMESVTTGCVSIKQNIHLVKNVMVPIELIPARVVMVCMVSQIVSMIILLILSGLNGSISWHLAWLPLVFALQVFFLVGLVWILSCLAVAIPDVSYFVNLFILLLLFISPIGFKPEMVPAGFTFMIYLNPIYYMIEMYRDSMLYGKWPDVLTLLVYLTMCLGTFALGSMFFRKFKNIVVDYE